jgi:hypothetical protein
MRMERLFLPHIDLSEMSTNLLFRYDLVAVIVLRYNRIRRCDGFEGQTIVTFVITIFVIMAELMAIPIL